MAKKSVICTQQALDAARKRLYRAMTAADKHGYTGMVDSKGGLFDDPRVQAARRYYDRFIDRCRR